MPVIGTAQKRLTIGSGLRAQIINTEFLGTTLGIAAPSGGHIRIYGYSLSLDRETTLSIKYGSTLIERRSNMRVIEPNLPGYIDLPYNVPLNLESAELVKVEGVIWYTLED